MNRVADWIGEVNPPFIGDVLNSRIKVLWGRISDSLCYGVISMSAFQGTARYFNMHVCGVDGLGIMSFTEGMWDLN